LKGSLKIIFTKNHYGQEIVWRQLMSYRKGIGEMRNSDEFKQKLTKMQEAPAF
jgi:hypothetical protein